MAANCFSAGHARMGGFGGVLRAVEVVERVKLPSQSRWPRLHVVEMKVVMGNLQPEELPDQKINTRLTFHGSATSFSDHLMRLTFPPRARLFAGPNLLSSNSLVTIHGFNDAGYVLG